MSTPEVDQRFLTPCPGPDPAGIDLAYSDLWLQIREARRHEDAQNLGIWERELKEADWRSVVRLCTAALAESSKDLRLAIWHLEASLRIEGLPALRNGLALLRELMRQYWDSGLYPRGEDSDDIELRLNALSWLNGKLAQEASQAVLARNPRTGFEICFDDCLKVRSVTIEDSATPIDLEKVKETLDLLKQEHLSSVRQLAEASAGELRWIEKWLNDKVGPGVVSFHIGREAIDNIAIWFTDFAPATLKPAEVEPQRTLTSSIVVDLASPQADGPRAAAESGTSADAWTRAEELARSACPQEGISEMARLAAAAPCGREVFIRKLDLAETCLETGAGLLAASVFEELAEQIDSFKLEQWEPSDLIGRVWLGIYKSYSKKSSGVDNTEKAAKAYVRYCRLNPWKAYDSERLADIAAPSND